MRHAIHPSTDDLIRGAGTGELLAGLRRRGCALLAGLTARRARRIMADELSPALQRDIGLEESPDPARGPIIEVDGAVMRRLMSLR
jgi:hypothetical protein